MNHQRNLNKVQVERLRKVIDPSFNMLHDQLETAYYQFWKLGKSKPFYGYDKLTNLSESKLQFDQLHGYLWHLYSIALHRYNKQLAPEDQYPESKYNIFQRDNVGNIIKTKEQEALEQLKLLPVNGIELVNKLKQILRMDFISQEEL